MEDLLETWMSTVALQMLPYSENLVEQYMQDNLWPFSRNYFLSDSIKRAEKLWLGWLILSSPRGISPRDGAFIPHWWKETLTPNFLVAVSVFLNPRSRLDKLHLIITSYPGGGRSCEKTACYRNTTTPPSKPDKWVNWNLIRCARKFIGKQ